MGLPCALSLLALAYNDRFPNAHYTGIGVWAGVLLRMTQIDVPLGVMIVPAGGILFHLVCIFKNEGIFERFKKLYMNFTWKN